MIEDRLTLWLNIATGLVLTGAIFYATLIPYMTRDD